MKQEDLDRIQEVMSGHNFPWFYLDRIVFPDDALDINNFQFVHVFYIDSTPVTKTFQIISPILDIIQPLSILKIKANLRTKTSTIVENELHVDLSNMPEEKQKQCTTSIFYINTNNGYTKFEDGTIVESVANRMVSFPANMKHCGTSCTDEKMRVVINFNYWGINNE